MNEPEIKPPLPPFTGESAKQKVQAAEDAWNTSDPERVALAYTSDSKWRNRDEFFEGRDAIVDFLRKGQWWRSHGNEHWEFEDNGLMRRRDASINDYRIMPEERRIASRLPSDQIPPSCFAHVREPAARASWSRSRWRAR